MPNNDSTPTREVSVAPRAPDDLRPTLVAILKALACPEGSRPADRPHGDDRD